MLFCGTLLAALVALLQTDIKRIIAYSSIAHMSVCSFGFFTKSLTALLSAYLILIAHGFVSGALFFLIGCLYDRIHARLLRNISGLASLMPLFSIYFVLFSLANIGFPLSFNFCVEFGLFLGLFQNNFLVGLFGSLGIILSGFFSMWLVNRLLFGGLKITYSYAFIDLYLTEHLVLIILFVPTLYFGINFSKISVLVEQALLTYLFT